ncbi:hypothetical protein SAMD00019534_096160 [Acytostelium subglobosum LB1]|uniref:hypothetical protein n=1 Tax=Acytostelium subglobosum LB1 TaxID=1410327 RepID=UPI000645103E|nr:hypothetical protein SAMD00019534_096160 [Acytostelium subglobosum LB1]GAM26441.1 hypothetical protein SAMD00019534_096160 [Acytostelium subglobosum LB1]|eukprot:XP_012750537.1 hypothetical protein SAMD00019534_096160 [Acytostelium subglobosum LB1]
MMDRSVNQSGGQTSSSNINNSISSDPLTSSMLIYITVSPWDDRQSISGINVHTLIGDIQVFFKQTGRSIKIRELDNYALYKSLDYGTRAHLPSTVGDALHISMDNGLQQHKTTTRIKLKGSGHFKRRLRMSNNQTLHTYNINGGTHLELRQVSSSLAAGGGMPRWFYKTIVPSNQLETLLKESATASNPSSPTQPHQHRGSSGGVQLVEISNDRGSGGSSGGGGSNRSASPSISVDPLMGRSLRNVSDFVDTIKTNKIVMVESPKRSVRLWRFATPTHNHNKRVLDVVQRIENHFPSILPESQLPNVQDTEQPLMDDRWEARISSSDDLVSKCLCMEDNLGQESLKQEYIEFSLRFEQRTSLLIGVDSRVLVWIDPIETYFTLCFSGTNTTVHDAITFIVQYLYPAATSTTAMPQHSHGLGLGLGQGNGQSSPPLVPGSSLADLISGYGLYLHETSEAKPIALQHKQLLSNCKMGGKLDMDEDITLMFKARHQRRSKKPAWTTESPLTAHLPPPPLPSLIVTDIEEDNTSNSESDVGDDIDEDGLDDEEGHNLTVLFPSHQTYRQFHFNPNRTVNEIIQYIIDSTTSSKQDDLDSSGSIVSPSTEDASTSGATTPMRLSLSSNRHSFTTKPISPDAACEQRSISTFRNKIFNNVSETDGLCLYHQKDGAGVWMEGNRTLLSYCLPREVVVEFKQPPTISRMTLVEGIRNTIKVHYKQQSFIVVYGRYTMINDLRDLLLENCCTSPEEEREVESCEMYLVKASGLTIPLNHIDRFELIQIDTQDIIEFRPTLIQSMLIKESLQDFVGPQTLAVIPGEHILHKRNSERVVGGQHKKGMMFLTNYRFIFNAYNRSSYDDAGTKDDCDLPITLIHRVKHSSNTNLTELTCKDFRVCVFPTGDMAIWDKLRSYHESGDISKTFAFSNAEPMDASLDTVYNVVDEFIRLKFPITDWRITYVNQDYGMCPTYPSQFIVPESVSDDQLNKIASFREKGRVPAICWIHSLHRSTISRCSQPRVGIFKSKCNEDEEYLRVITKSNTNCKILTVMDSRPMANAKANTLLGKGHEDTNLYSNVELKFLGIGNIHVMRDSYKKLFTAIQSPDTNLAWLSLLEDSQYLQHIHQLIHAANMVVDLVDKKGASVLTHCSDGWDRTSQLVSLSQLLLDPYYRTIKGFQVLIEKEWLSFGYQFTLRCNHITQGNNDEDFSPIFLMFIDAVWQLTNLFPTTFQFNERFLMAILDAMYNCKYGTFLFNSQRERNIQIKYNGALASLWTQINADLEQHTNYFYINNPKPLFHHYFPADIQFWSNYYLRWKDNYEPRMLIDSTIMSSVLETKKSVLGATKSGSSNK